MALPAVIARHISQAFFLIGAEAVDRFSQDAAGAGLARSPGAVEKIGVGDALALDGITQSLGYRRLTDYIGQGLRAPLAIKNLRCHRCLYYTLNRLVSKGDFGADRRLLLNKNQLYQFCYLISTGKAG
jgi:hypothetical protein